MKFKKYLQMIKEENDKPEQTKADKPKQTKDNKNSEDDKNPEDEKLEKIIELRIKLKNAKSDNEADNIQSQINKLLNQQDKDKIKDTVDKIDKTNKEN